MKKQADKEALSAPTDMTQIYYKKTQKLARESIWELLCESLRPQNLPFMIITMMLQLR